MEHDVCVCLINLKKNFYYVFIFGCAGSSLLHGLSRAVVGRSSSLVAVLGILLLWSVGSRARAQ